MKLGRHGMSLAFCECFFFFNPSRENFFLSFLRLYLYFFLHIANFETHDGKYCTPGFPTLSTLVRIQKVTLMFFFPFFFVFFNFSRLLSVHSPFFVFFCCFLVLAHNVPATRVVPQICLPRLLEKSAAFIQCKTPPPDSPASKFCISPVLVRPLPTPPFGSLPPGRPRASWRTSPTRPASSPWSPWRRRDRVHS